MKEDVARIHGPALTPVQRRRQLPTAENQVDPPVQPQTDVLALQRLSMTPHELPRVSMSPPREFHVSHRLSGGLGAAEVEPSGVDEELRQVVELGYGFLHVAWVVSARSVGVGKRLEETVCLVKPPVLCVGERGVGRESSRGYGRTGQ